jgi:hypothetical protein
MMERTDIPFFAASIDKIAVRPPDLPVILLHCECRWRAVILG